MVEHGFLATVAQIMVAPFQFEVGFPDPLVQFVGGAGRVLYLEVPLPSVVNLAVLVSLAALVAADAVLLLVPLQHLHTSLGSTIVQGMHLNLTLKQSFLAIPAARFLFSACGCAGGVASFLDVDCASPAHVASSTFAVALVLALVAVGWHHEHSRHDAISKARLGTALALGADRNPGFALAMMLLKVMMALVLGLLRDVLPSAVNIALLLALGVITAAAVALSQPFFSTSWNAYVLGGLAAILFTNTMALLSLAFPTTNAQYILATAWLGLLLPVAFTTRNIALGVFVTGLEAKTLGLLASAPRGDAAGDAPAAKGAVAVPGPQTRVVNLRRSLVGLPDSTWSALYRALATSRAASGAVSGMFLDLSFNEVSPANMQLTLGAISTNAAIMVSGLSLAGNEELFLPPTEKTGAAQLNCLGPAPELSPSASVPPLAGLGAFLVQYTPLTKLDLSHIPLSPGTLDTLVTALVHSRVAQLSLAHCGLTPLHGAALARLLSDSTTLTHLNLTGNKDLAPAGAELMAPGIAHCTARGQLQHLDVSWCGLQLQGATAVLNAVNRDGCAALPKPLALHMHCNDIPFQTFAQLKGQLSQLLSAGLPASTTLAEQAEANEAALAEVLGGKTIYEAIGGAPAVHAVVDTFYIFLVSHPATAPFFKNVAMGRMRHLQETFISTVLGAGDVKYSGKDMAAGHAHLGITDDVFDQTVALLVSAILHHLPEAPVPILHKLLAVVETLREPVVDGSTRGALPDRSSLGKDGGGAPATSLHVAGVSDVESATGLSPPPDGLLRQCTGGSAMGCAPRDTSTTMDPNISGMSPRHGRSASVSASDMHPLSPTLDGAPADVPERDTALTGEHTRTGHVTLPPQRLAPIAIPHRVASGVDLDDSASCVTLQDAAQQ